MYITTLLDPNDLSGRVLSQRAQAWVADITYIQLPTSFVSLACVLDAWSRRCWGWQRSRRIDTQLALAALAQAITLRQATPGLIHHADRGVHYASTAYVERLNAIGA